MKTLFLLGSTGFLGTNFLNKYSNKFKITIAEKDLSNFDSHDIVLNFAGKAHDLKKTINASAYYDVNTNLSNKLFDKFIQSNSKVFITISSVKAVSDKVNDELFEDSLPNPQTHYGKSKLLAEQHICENLNTINKRIFILRPCMIHGPGNKGNLNLLYKLMKIGLPWPLAKFQNKRSFCSVENLFFIINELIINENINSGIYNIADDEPLSTNEVIKLIGISLNRKIFLIKVPVQLIFFITRICDLMNLSFNSENLNKLTESYVVSNKKIRKSINKKLPLSSKEGLLKTFKSFKNNV